MTAEELDEIKAWNDAGQYSGRPSETQRAISALLAEVERLREALRFYADGWQGNSDGDSEVPGGVRTWMEPTDDLWNDAGERARKALEPTHDR